MISHSKSLFNIFTFAALLASLLGSALNFTPARAASIIINTNADGNPTNDGFCTLREAIINANNDNQSGSTDCATGFGVDTITFDVALSGATININSQLAITEDASIDGSTLSTKITISGDTNNDGTGDVRVFTIGENATVSIDSLIITKGNPLFFGGGGILNYGTLTITNSTISSSVGPANGGGGILNWYGALNVIDSSIMNNPTGSGIVNYNGITTISGSIITGNTDTFFGGGIKNFGSLSITNSTISNNSATSGSGGGIYVNNGTLTIVESIVSNNTAGGGGGGGIDTSGDDLTINNTTFSGNSGKNGGGINNRGSAMTVTNSTFFGNTASESGGGIYSKSSPGIIVNSTFSGNSALKQGGGVYHAFAYNLMVINSTFSGNSAELSGGGIYTQGALSFSNTIIANSNSGGDCIKGVLGTINTNTNNLIEDGSCSASLNGDPKLIPLADNGGYTKTMALLSGSPAIDAGDDAICGDSFVNNFDQRGASRPEGAHCDIGAYEGSIPILNATFNSTAAQDGWILESTETSNKGGKLNKGATTLQLGDDAARKQYLSILSFDTSSIPDNAVITKVTLKVKQQGITGGGNPVNMLQGFVVDIKRGTFGAPALALTDFQAKANKSVGPVKKNPNGSGWYVLNLSPGKNFVNKLASGNGLTQIRIRFKLDDNNDALANIIKLYSGNAGATSRPRLTVEYYVP